MELQGNHYRLRENYFSTHSKNEQKNKFKWTRGGLTFVCVKTIADIFIVEDKRYFAYMQIDII